MYISRRSLSKFSLLTGATAAPLALASLRPTPTSSRDGATIADAAGPVPSPSPEGPAPGSRPAALLPAPAAPKVLLDVGPVPAPLAVTDPLLAIPVAANTPVTFAFTFSTRSLARQTLLSLTGPAGAGSPADALWLGLQDGRPALHVAAGGEIVTRFEPRIHLADGERHTLVLISSPGVLQFLADGSSVGVAAETARPFDLAVDAAHLARHDHPDAPTGLVFEGQLEHARVQTGALDGPWDAAEGPALPRAVTLPALATLRALADSPEPLKWLFTGDSITQGSEATAGWRTYVNHFDERQRYERLFTRQWVLNTGISGSTCRDLLADFEWRVSEQRARVVSLMIGMNDFHDGLERLGAFRAAVDEVIARSRALGAEVMLQVAPPEWRDAVGTGVLHAYNECVRELGWERRVPVIDHSAHLLREGRGVAPTVWYHDAPHPNGYGHYQMATLLLRSVGVYGAGRFAEGYAYPQVSSVWR
ncbi:hypothetical protein JT358_03580 [Micrococcales bacterium 31B]|nr:hypothetical protein [Micrococcales bacterium 31B]